MTTADAAGSSDVGPGGVPTAPPSTAITEAYYSAYTPSILEGGGGGGGGSRATRSVLRKSRTGDILEKGALALRTLASLFSLVTLVVLVSNKHGDWQDFDRYQEYRYLLAICVIAFVYSMAQVLRKMRRKGEDLLPTQSSWIVDFAGDQVMAYLLISAVSAAIPITSHMREAVINMFTDASAASISMAFLAFVALALSALLSGFKISKQNDI